MPRKMALEPQSPASEPAPAIESSGPETRPRESKISMVLTMLSRDQGATLDELTSATGWQPHTTRAALTGLRKKGHVIIKARRGDTTCYHLGGEA